MLPTMPSYAQVTQLPLTYQTTVSEDWIDLMGHMNVSWYTSSFSKAMQCLRSTWGLNDETVQEQNIGTFAIETHTRYVAELHVGQRLQVYSRALGRSRSPKRLHAIHLMVNQEKQTVCASFEAIVAHVDLNSRRMTPMLPDVLANLDKMIAEHQKLAWAPPVCGVMSC